MLLNTDSRAKIPLKTFPELSDSRCKGVFVIGILGKERSIRNRKILPEQNKCV